MTHHGAVPRLQIVAAAILFSTGGAAIKACSLSAWQVACLRSAVAAVVVLLLIPAARRAWTPMTWVVGASYAATLTLYVTANKLTTAANTIFLQGTAPLYIVLLGPWLLGERLRRRDLALMAALVIGMSLFFVGAQPIVTTAPHPLRGNVLAGLAGLCWALTIMGLRRLGHGGANPGAAVVCGNLLAACATLPFALPATITQATDWLWIAYLGAIQVALAYRLLTSGLARVQALEGSLLLLVEPVLNPVWAWLLHGEAPTRWALIGGAIILTATTVSTWLAERRQGPVSATSTE